MRSTLLLGTIAALVAGVAVSAQASILASLGRSVGALRAGLLTYTLGGALAALALLVLTMRWAPPTGQHPRDALLWSATAGACGVVILTAIAYSTARVSVAAGLGVILVGQMATAFVFDALGLGGITVPVDARRLLGLVVIGAGTYLLLPR